MVFHITRMARVRATFPNIISVSRGAADLIFVICSVIIILPSLELPLWVWLWIAAIGAVKLVGITIGAHRQRRLAIPHSISHRLTGILLFCLPFAIVRFDALIPAVIVGISATASLFEDFHIIRK